MSKYKKGDKVVMEIFRTDDDGYYELGNDNRSGWWFGTYINETSEPLGTYTEPLEAKIRRQAAEITRLLAENKELKEESKRNYTINIEMAKAEGHSEAWELARKIVAFKEDGGYIEYYNYTQDVMKNYSYPEAAAKVSQWEKAKEEIKVGDIYRGKTGNFVICSIFHEKNTVRILWDDSSAGTRRIDEIKKDYVKTGRHIDIDSFLEQIGEE